MISENSLKYLENSITIFDKLTDKRYLICYQPKDKMLYLELQIDHTHFWHLLGCKTKDNLSIMEKEILYQSILSKNYENKEIILSNLDYTHSFKEVGEKYEAFIKNFDFIKNGKILDIKDSKNTPEFNLFQYMIGSSSGIIGYKEAKEYKKIYIPNSSQKKSIYKNASPFILILSKDSYKYGYDKIEYAITKKIEYIKEVVKDIPLKYKVNIYVDNKELTNKKKVYNIKNIEQNEEINKISIENNSQIEDI